MKAIKSQQKNIKELISLIQKNPTLEIMPMVSSECIPSDDWGYWAADWGKAKVDEYFVDRERIYFKEQDYDELIEQFIDNNYDGHPNLTGEELEKMAENEVNSYEWTKVIVVYIKPL